MDSNECAVLNSQDAFDAWMSVVLPEGWRGGRYRPLELDAFGRLSLIAEVERVTGEPFTEALLDSLTTLTTGGSRARGVKERHPNNPGTASPGVS